MKNTKIIAGAFLIASLALNSAFAANMTMPTTSANTKTNVVSTNKATTKKIVVKHVNKKPTLHNEKTTVNTGSTRK